VALLKAVFATFQRPAIQSSIALLIPENSLDRANALMQMIGPSSSVIAPILTGVLYSIIGLPGIFVIDLLTFIFSILVIVLVKFPVSQDHSADPGKHQWFAEFTAGFRFIWSFQSLLVLNLFLALVNFFFGAAVAIMPAYLLSRLNSEAMAGSLLGLSSFGAIIGGVIVGIRGGGRSRVHTIIASVSLTGVCIALLGLSQNFIFLGAALLFSFLPLPIANATAVSIVQTKVPLNLQARVFAVQEQIYLFMLPLAYLLVGPLSDEVLTPLTETQHWVGFGAIFGVGITGSLALIITCAGISIILIALLTLRIPIMRELDTN
jgi:hypothetical protein